MILFCSGGGIGGLTLAFALSKSPDVHVDVYEAASEFAEIGAGIVLQWRARQILTSLGLEEDIIRLLPSHPGEDKGEPGMCSRCMTPSKSLQRQQYNFERLISPTATP